MHTIAIFQTEINMKDTKLAPAAFAAMIMLATASPAFADHGSGSGSNGSGSGHAEDRPHPEDRPNNPPSNPSTAIPAAATMKATVERKADTKRGVLRKDEFEAKLQFPVPFQVAGITTEDEAAGAEVLIALSRNGQVYAQCLLELDRLRETRRHVKAEFTARMRLKAGKHGVATEAKDGECDTDLSTPGNENMVPDARSSDTFTFSVNGVAVSTTPKVKIRIK